MRCRSMHHLKIDIPDVFASPSGFLNIVEWWSWMTYATLHAHCFFIVYTVQYIAFRR